MVVQCNRQCKRNHSWQVLRSFTVLFEDYLPIRLAGRRIYAHLTRVMEEARLQRAEEISVAREVCPSWDRTTGGGENAIKHARNLWDTIMDAALLQEPERLHEQCQEGGAVPFSQLLRLGFDRCLMREGLVEDSAELERMVRQILQEETDLDQCGAQGEQRELQVSFATFMKVLCLCTSQREYHHHERLLCGMAAQVDVHITATMLTERAINSGGTAACKQRQHHSNRYDGYVAQFKSWEDGVLDNRNAAGRHHSRRWDILRGCFVGARNAKIVAALKIVYVDYAALRVAGDLIFKLVSKLTK